MPRKAKRLNRRLTREQTHLLEIEHQRDNNWTTRHVTEIARRMGLNRTKIYKWQWERKKKTDS